MAALRSSAFTCFLGLFLALLWGCEAAQHVSRGDDALRTNRPQQARVHYQQAVRVDPKLASDPVFLQKLREASWRGALADAEAAASAGEWAKAVAHYEESLTHQPGYAPAVAALAKAKVEAAEQNYRKALAAADRADLQSAGEILRQAVAWDPNHSNARMALDSLDRRGTAASEQAFASVLKLTEQRDWQRAADDLKTLIDSDPNHLPARAELARAGGAMAQSRQAHEQGSRQLADRKLDEAIASARRSLDIWPTNSDSADLLHRAQAARDRAEQLFADAKQFAADGNFDGAVASVLQSLEVFPTQVQARKFAGEVKQTAAEAYTAQARRQLDAGQIEAAAGSFRSALKFVPTHRPASDGLVDVSYAHGQGAEKEGLWGNALLWYMDAASQKPTGVYKQAEDRARAAIAKRVAFDLALSVADARGNTNPDTAELHKRVIHEGDKAKPAFVTLTGAAADGAENNLPRPLLKAMVTLRSIAVQQESLGRERKEHQYSAVRTVPNPALPQLERSLIDAERELAAARSRLVRFDCSDCGGRGHAVCSSCRGTKLHVCGTCRGSGRIRAQGGGFILCTACGGHSRHTCEVCRGAGHLRCSRCGGRGSYNDYDHNLIRSKGREVADLRNRLRSESPTVQEPYVIKVPYEQETYRKTGRVDATLRVVDSGGSEVQSVEVTPSYTKEDLVTIGADPQVGLPADGLDLPTDDAVYRVVLDEAAKNTATNMLAAATVARANAYIAEANQHAQAGKTDLDIEARVAAMVLLEQTQPTEAKRLLTEIRSGK